MEYKFFDDEGQLNLVELDVVYKDRAIRPYGIQAKIFRDGKLAESAAAEERFITRKEAEETLNMLYRFQVTPCTLCDVI